MTLNQHYHLIEEGKGNKDQFLKQARHLFPQYINNLVDYKTTVNILKSKQILTEGKVIEKNAEFDISKWKQTLTEGEVKAEEKKTSKEVLDNQKKAYDNKDLKNLDNINFNEILKGFYAEVGDDKNKDKSVDELKQIVAKNLAKDPLYYTKNGMFGVKGIGFSDEQPGLNKPKEAKGKYKGSGYGDLDAEEKPEKVKANTKTTLSDSEAKTKMPKKVKEMEVTPKTTKGVKKMAMPGKEKKIKLKLDENQSTQTSPDHGVSGPNKEEKPSDTKEWFTIEQEVLKDKGYTIEDIGDPDIEDEVHLEVQKRFQEKFGREPVFEGVLQEIIFNLGKGGGGKRFVPKTTDLTQSIIDEINKIGEKKNLKHIKIVSGENGSIKFLISGQLYNALSGLKRGKPANDKSYHSAGGSGIPTDIIQKIPNTTRAILKNSAIKQGNGSYLVDIEGVELKDGKYVIPMPSKEDVVTENEDSIYDMMDDLELQLMNETDPERKAEIEKKLLDYEDKLKNINENKDSNKEYLKNKNIKAFDAANTILYDLTRPPQIDYVSPKDKRKVEAASEYLESLGDGAKEYYDYISKEADHYHGEEGAGQYDSLFEIGNASTHGTPVKPSQLQKGETYVWTGGAELLDIKYIGLSKDNPEIKAPVSIGKGFIFQFNHDNSYVELGGPTITQDVIYKEEEKPKSLKEFLTTWMKSDPKLEAAYKEGYNSEEQSVEGNSYDPSMDKELHDAWYMGYIANKNHKASRSRLKEIVDQLKSK